MEMMVYLKAQVHYMFVIIELFLKVTYMQLKSVYIGRVTETDIC